MSDHVCDICGEKAIGCQILGCCGSYVCWEHADKQLKTLKSGEKQELGACYYWRFEEDAE
ncbi:MAG: hypothetical protein D5R96_08455 [Methanocalculus sp. MSAO_Arc2]|nr:MAG: hypothetical protein D5R96_08455 [Methanocalculus sp. MSAO_Arc2]